MDTKNIYPAVFMNLIKVYGGRESLKMDTYLRTKYRGKWYLWHFHRDRDISSDPGKRENDILTEIEQFHGEVYRVMILGKIAPKSVHPLVFDRSVFELDPDQRSEEERLIPEY